MKSFLVAASIKELQGQLGAPSVPSQVEAVLQLGDLVAQHPLPTMIAPVFQSLAQLFFNGSNFVRQYIVRMLRLHGALISRVTDASALHAIVSPIALVLSSNDWVSRCLSLKLISHLDIQATADVHLAVLTRFTDATMESEVSAAICCVGKLAQRSAHFARVALEPVTSRLKHHGTAPRHRVLLLRVMGRFGWDSAMRAQAQDALVAITNELPIEPVVSAAIKSLTELQIGQQLICSILLAHPLPSIQMDCLRALFRLPLSHALTVPIVTFVLNQQDHGEPSDLALRLLGKIGKGEIPADLLERLYAIDELNAKVSAALCCFESHCAAAAARLAPHLTSAKCTKLEQRLAAKLAHSNAYACSVFFHHIMETLERVSDNTERRLAAVRCLLLMPINYSAHSRLCEIGKANSGNSGDSEFQATLLRVAIRCADPLNSGDTSQVLDNLVKSLLQSGTATHLQTYLLGREALCAGLYDVAEVLLNAVNSGTHSKRVKSWISAICTYCSALNSKNKNNLRGVTYLRQALLHLSAAEMDSTFSYHYVEILVHLLENVLLGSGARAFVWDNVAVLCANLQTLSLGASKQSLSHLSDLERTCRIFACCIEQTQLNPALRTSVPPVTPLQRLCSALVDTFGSPINLKQVMNSLAVAALSSTPRAFFKTQQSVSAELNLEPVNLRDGAGDPTFGHVLHFDGVVLGLSAIQQPVDVLEVEVQVIFEQKIVSTQRYRCNLAGGTAFNIDAMVVFPIPKIQSIILAKLWLIDQFDRPWLIKEELLPMSRLALKVN